VLWPPLVDSFYLAEKQDYSEQQAYFCSFTSTWPLNSTIPSLATSYAFNRAINYFYSATRLVLHYGKSPSSDTPSNSTRSGEHNVLTTGFDTQDVGLQDLSVNHVLKAVKTLLDRLVCPGWSRVIRSYWFHATNISHTEFRIPRTGPSCWKLLVGFQICLNFSVYIASSIYVPVTFERLRDCSNTRTLPLHRVRKS
jgi:hypothetical protein